MSDDEKFMTIRAMKQFGGSFVKSLADTWMLGDEENRARIECAFHEYMVKYGPCTAPYIAAERAKP